MKIGILGYGEIGKAIHQLYSSASGYEIFVKDIDRDDGLENIDVLNVCIPAISDFVKVVSEIAFTSSAKLVIIHSTIRVGTTESLQETLPVPVVHSPVRGVHPNLFKGIMTFEKFVGATSKENAKFAEKHLSDLGVNVKILKSSRETELGKLLDTTYYGIAISWHAEMKKICDQFNVAFEDAVTYFNETYNSGYTTLGMKNVVRPVLYPPVGGIGGHCVVPNAKILKETFESEGLDMILKYSRDNT